MTDCYHLFKTGFSIIGYAAAKCQIHGVGADAEARARIADGVVGCSGYWAIEEFQVECSPCIGNGVIGNGEGSILSVRPNAPVPTGCVVKPLGVARNQVSINNNVACYRCPEIDGAIWIGIGAVGGCGPDHIVQKSNSG